MENKSFNHFRICKNLQANFKMISTSFKYIFNFENNQFHYNVARNLHFNRNLAPNLVVYNIEQMYLLVLSLRMTLPLLQETYHGYDPLIYYIFKNDKASFDSSFVIAMIMGAINCFCLRHFFTSIPQSGFTWKYFYDLTCNSVDIYRNCRKTSKEMESLIEEETEHILQANATLTGKLPLHLTTLVCRQISKHKLAKNFQNIRTEMFMKQKLQFYPNLSYANRVKNVQLMLGFDQVSSILFAALCESIAVLCNKFTFF